MVSVRGNQPNNKVTASSSTSTNNRAEVKPVNINNQVEATNNLAKYYSEISQDWAEGEGLIQNIDYSSKTYALQSKDSANDAKSTLEQTRMLANETIEQVESTGESIVSSLNELEGSIRDSANVGLSQLAESTEQALNDLETASEEILENVENNSRALPMFSPIWSDHLLNDVSYLRADTFSWHSGYIYKTAYEVLLNEYNNENCVEEVENGVTYKRSPNGFKIASVEQNDVILDVYNNTGIAWYYIIDVVNMQFKLPRTQWGFVGNRDGVGGQIEAGLPSVVHTHTFSATTTSNGAHTHTVNYTGSDFDDGESGNHIQINSRGTTYAKTLTAASAGAHTHTVSGTTGGANITSNIYGKSDTVQPPATQMYLYFYIGNYQRPATEIQTGKVFDVLANKADIDGGNYVGSGLEKRIDNTLDEFLANTKDSFLNKSQITNCITEIPQRIKLKLNGGTLTLKAGSVVIVPYGTEDLTSQYPVGATFINDNFKVVDTQYTEDAEGNGKFFVWAKTLIDLSETRAVTSVYKLFFYVNFEANTLGSASISPAVSGEGVGKSQLKYRTDDNTVNYYNASSEAQQPNLSLPMGISESTGTYVYDKINQVFNGMGYIGTTVWIDKGVKGLIPNGRNEDGTLRNIEATIPSLLVNTKTSTTSQNYTLFFSYEYNNNSIALDNHQYFLGELENAPSSPLQYCIYFNTITNTYQQYIDGNWVNKTRLMFGNYFNATDNVILNYSPKQPFRAVDYNEFANRHCTTKATTTSSATSLNPAVVIQNYVSGTSWYRVWSDGWIEQGGYSSGSSGRTVALIKNFTTTNYSINGAIIGTSATGDNSIVIGNLTTSNFKIYSANATRWYACGY